MVEPGRAGAKEVRTSHAFIVSTVVHFSVTYPSLRPPTTTTCSCSARPSSLTSRWLPRRDTAPLLPVRAQPEPEPDVLGPAAP